ncbi:hypothetical protein TeGR_g13817, partial [Tetraparma gracilis]
MVYPGQGLSQRWGNALSPYWQARALAEVGGFDFTTGEFLAQKSGKLPDGRVSVAGEVMHDEMFFKYLPSSVSAKEGRNRGCFDPAVFKDVCMCQQQLGFGKQQWFTHLCERGWADIVPTIRDDSQRALAKWEDENEKARGTPHHVEGGNYDARRNVEEWTRENGWFIWARCVPGRNDIHGLVAMSLLDQIGKVGGDNVGSINIGGFEGDSPDDSEFCKWWKGAIVASLRARFPEAKTRVIEHGTRVNDFSLLMLAPNVLIMSSGSTWATWGVMANPGN